MNPVRLATDDTKKYTGRGPSSRELRRTEFNHVQGTFRAGKNVAHKAAALGGDTQTMPCSAAEDEHRRWLYM